MFDKRRKQIVEDLMHEINTCVHTIKICKRDGDKHFEMLYRDRLMHTTQMACEFLKHDVITHDDYKFLYNLEIDFYNWERENTSWVEEIVQQKKNEYAQEDYKEHVESQLKLFLKMFGFREDENA